MNRDVRSFLATKVFKAMIDRQPLPRSSAAFARLIEALFEQLEQAFSEDEWSIVREPPGGPPGYRADRVIDREGLRYVVELRVAREARRPELPALLADALVRARVGAEAHGGRALGVVGAPVISDEWAAALEEHVQRFFPGEAWGFIDGSGRLMLKGKGLERLQRRGVRRRRKGSGPMARADVFSDLGQWMAKVLLAPNLPERYLHAPRRPSSGPSQLASVAGVSVPSASRLVTRLRNLNFLDDADGLSIIRRDRFFAEWRKANRFLGRERPCRWIFPAPDSLARLSSALERPQRQRVCLGLFAACERLGLGFVRGAPVHVYLEEVSDTALEELELMPAAAGEHVDVFVREPMFPESVFRGAVHADSVPTADVLQCWLDVADHPVRGAEQAEHIWKRVIAPNLLEAASA